MFEFVESVFLWIADRPLFALAAITLPWLLIAWLRRVYPSKIMMGLFALIAFLSIGITFQPALLGWVLIADAILLGIALLDLFSLSPQRKFSATRSALRVASQGKPHDVELSITNKARWQFNVVVRDDLAEEFLANPLEFRIALRAKNRSVVKYSFVPKERGKFEFAFVHLLLRSRLRLWNAFYRLPCRTEFHVYPDMKQLSEYAILARTNRLSLVGVRRTRKIGQDNEFERLRDYNQDDNYKHIDWHSTARRQKLTVRDFQANQSQRIVFLVDCGRMMTNLANGISLLDHSLNAMLMLSHVALSKGDSVGLICFSDTIHNYTPPRGGLKQMNRLLHASFDRHPQLVESRYDQAFLYLRTHCLKRSLVVLVSNVIDEVNAHQVHQYLGSLVGRHLPLGVLLRDHRLFHPLESDNLSGDQLYQAAAAAEIVGWRQQVIADLQHQGALMMDVYPEQLTARMVNQYLEIKARHLL